MTAQMDTNANRDTRLPLAELVHPSWVEALQPIEPKLHELGDRLREEAAHKRYFLPAGANILRAFTYPLPDVKVLIVGQDPYPTPGHAIGLSFAVAPGVEPPRSLENIFRELVSDIGCNQPTSGDLTPWSEQGVMLLNRVLTVRAEAAGSHQNWGWEEITDCAIKALIARNQPLVAILWGRQAQSLKPLLDGANIIESSHPSPLSARRSFFGSRPFSRANDYLVSAGIEPIDWSLP